MAIIAVFERGGRGEGIQVRIQIRIVGGDCEIKTGFRV